MINRRLVREAVELVAMVLGAAALTVIVFALLSQVVGGRGPSPSETLPGGNQTALGHSEAAPARPSAATTEAVSVGGGSGEDGGSSDLADFAPRGRDSGSDAPASTVTTQALVTATVVIDPVPATPVTTSPAVVTQGAESDNTVSVSESGAYYAQKNEITSLIAASPWPQYLHGKVACLVERESRGQAWIVSPGGDVGLMQVGPVNFAFLAERGITRAMLFDGATNLAAGWILYEWWQGVNGDGWTPWASTRGGCA